MVAFLKQNIVREIPIAFAIGSSTPIYVALQADLETIISMTQNNESVLVEGTNDVNDAAGDALVDIDDAVNWSELVFSIADFIRASAGLTGVRITPQNSPGTSAGTGTVTQYKPRPETAKS